MSRMPVVSKGQSKKKGASGALSTGSKSKENKNSVSSGDEEETKKGAAASSASSTNSSSSSGSSSSSSSGNDSSSSDSDDGSSSSSSDSDSSSSSGSNPNNNNAANKDKTKGDKEKPIIGVRTRSLSRSSRSRASSAASSASTASSTASSRKGSPSPKKSVATSAVSSTTIKKSKSSHPPPTSGSTSNADKKSQKGSHSTKTSGTVINKPSTANSVLSKTELSKGSSGTQQANSSKKKGKKEEKNSKESSSSHQNNNSVPSTSTTSTTKSKVVKSGTVTNTRTIKPLSSNIPHVKKTKASSSTTSSSVSKLSKLTAITAVSSTKNLGTKKLPNKHLPTKTSKQQAVPEKPVKKPNSAGALSSKNSKSSVVVVSTTTTSPPSAPVASRTRHQSSCSSFSSTASSSASNSSAEDEEEPTPATTPSKEVNKKILKRKKETVTTADKAHNKQKVITKKKTLKKKTSEFLSKAEVLSSAEDESEAKSEAEEVGKEKKKKPAQQRRPVTRRQKLGTKKTIPTTTVFNQSLLMAAANSTSSPSATPTKKSSLAISSSSPGATGSTVGGLFPGELTPLAKSSIINRRSTSNSSANSSESEGFSSGIIKNFPVSSTLTTQPSSNKNKYISTWDSDFSDDNFNSQLSQSTANFIRVPAKTSNKPPRNLDLSLLDPEAYEPPRCPFPSCDSSGHLSGRYPSHNFLSCCPRYHGFDNDECTENDQERSRRESERLRYRNILSTPGKKPPKPTSETKQWVNSLKDLKAKDTENGLVSEYDNLLWKDALAIAADKIEKEQSEGINNQVLIGSYYRLSMAVAMGRFEMKCWCASPYPEPLSQNRRLFVCEFCLKPVGSGTILRRHCAKCVWRHPPGDEIYRKDRLSVWEVDGKKQKTYCQNLCLLAKCFLDHKTLYLDVDPFLFYVMTLADSQGCHLVGYFSKEKNSFLNYNVSCILTLPPYQRQGFGRLLIDFSYLLTRVEGKVGSPEKPLSDLGLISYRSYWKDAVLRRLCACASREINIKDLSIELGVSTADLISTLQYLGMLKYWKGKHLVLKKQDVLEEYLDRVRRRGEQRQIDSSCLRWRPYQPPPDENSSSEKS